MSGQPYFDETASVGFSGPGATQRLLPMLFPLKTVALRFHKFHIKLSNKQLRHGLDVREQVRQKHIRLLLPHLQRCYNKVYDIHDIIPLAQLQR